MKKEFLIKRILSNLILEDIQPNGEPKFINQEVVIWNDLDFIARCSLNNHKGPLFEYSIGFGYTIAKVCFNLLTEVFDSSIKSIIDSTFYEIDNLTSNPFNEFENNIVKIDQHFEKNIRSLISNNEEAYQFWIYIFSDCISYIVQHEIAHYFNGHCEYFTMFERDAYKICKKLLDEQHISELQSDVYAVQNLLNSKIAEKDVFGENYKIRNYSGTELSIYSIFLVFVILEAFDTEIDKSTHPKAIIRIVNSLKHLLDGIIHNNEEDTYQNAIKLILKRLKDLSIIADKFNINTTTWSESITYFIIGGSFENFTNETDDSNLLFDLQIKSWDFRYKLGRFANNAIDQLNEDDVFCSIFKFIYLSGNHIPWPHYYRENFIDYAIEKISFKDMRVIKSYLSTTKETGLDREATLNHIKKELKLKSMENKLTSQSIANYLKLTEDEIFSQIGKELLSSKVLKWNKDSDGPKDLDESKAGKAWFERFYEILQKKVCDSNIYNLIVSDKNKYDKTIIIASIADLISSICVGVSPIVVAVLILKLGLTEFCKSHFDI